MGNTILREILQEVKEVKWFTIMADETRDMIKQPRTTGCVYPLSQQNLQSLW